MRKQILLFGAGKSATYLIQYLIRECTSNNWLLVVADSDPALASSKTGGAAVARAVGLAVQNDPERRALIEVADIVISLLPPTLHYLVAYDCVLFGKHLLTASYLDNKIKGLQADVKSKGLLFLCEMGLDPGIDHMSAMEVIHRIKKQGGTIRSFKSHCGGLVAPETDDNPWHFKISWNPRNIVLAGKAGATFLTENKVINTSYNELFRNCEEVAVAGLCNLVYYPNRDSLSYIPHYGLEDSVEFIRTTLRYPVFCKAWHQLVRAGLTNDEIPVNTAGMRFDQWAAPLLPFTDPEILPLYDYLGVFDTESIPDTTRTSADILQHLLENRLNMQAGDKDMVVMLHQVAFGLKGENRVLESLLLVKGENSLQTAMAKTVGLPLGIAAKLILENKISLTGLHIPILPEIYEPVLRLLAAEGIVFQETQRVLH